MRGTSIRRTIEAENDTLRNLAAKLRADVLTLHDKLQRRATRIHSAELQRTLQCGIDRVTEAGT